MNDSLIGMKRTTPRGTVLRVDDDIEFVLSNDAVESLNSSFTVPSEKSIEQSRRTYSRINPLTFVQHDIVKEKLNDKKYLSPVRKPKTPVSPRIHKTRSLLLNGTPKNIPLLNKIEKQQGKGKSPQCQNGRKSSIGNSICSINTSKNNIQKSNKRTYESPRCKLVSKALKTTADEVLKATTVKKEVEPIGVNAENTLESFFEPSTSNSFKLKNAFNKNYQVEKRDKTSNSNFIGRKFLKKENFVDTYIKPSYDSDNENLVINEADTAPVMPTDSMLHGSISSEISNNSVKFSPTKRLSPEDSVSIPKSVASSESTKTSAPHMEGELITLLPAKTESVAKTKRRRRRGELDKLYENLKEISWAQDKDFISSLCLNESVRHSERVIAKNTDIMKHRRHANHDKKILKKKMLKKKVSRTIVTKRRHMPLLIKNKKSITSDNLAKKIPLTNTTKKINSGKISKATNADMKHIQMRKNLSRVVNCKKVVKEVITLSSDENEASPCIVAPSKASLRETVQSKFAMGKAATNKSISLKASAIKPTAVKTAVVKPATIKAAVKPTAIKVADVKPVAVKVAPIKPLLKATPVPAGSVNVPVKAASMNVHIKAASSKDSQITDFFNHASSSETSCEKGNTQISSDTSSSSLCGSTVDKRSRKRYPKNKNVSIFHGMNIFQNFLGSNNRLFPSLQRPPELRVTLEPLENTDIWSSNDYLQTTIHNEYETFRKQAIQQAMLKVIRGVDDGPINSMFRELQDNFATSVNNIKPSKKRKSEEESVRSSVRQSECAFRYKEIVVKKHENYIQVVLVPNGNKQNSLTVEAMKELKEAFLSAKKDPNCRAVLLNSSGSFFCSGIDLGQLVGANKKQLAEEMAVTLRDLIMTLGLFTKPVVAAVNGTAIGFGVALLTFCDIVLASDKATFSIPAASLGYIPEGAVTLTMPQVVGAGVAIEMLLQGRRLTAQQALRHGLVSEVIWPTKLMEEVIPRIHLLVSQSLQVMEATKTMVRCHLWEKLPMHVEQEWKILPSQWLDPACQHNMKKRLQIGWASE